MSTRERLHHILELEPMVHRRPLTMRFWVYSATAYLMPVVAQLGLPADPGLYDELVWLVTLAPAFLLSLHYGLNGALVGLLVGTLLFLVVQVSLALNFTADDWRITVPIYIAYGTLAISVGWLSQELHDHYQKQVKHERLAGIGELAVAVKHELNNALQLIIIESQLLTECGDALGPEEQQSVASILSAARRISDHLQRITNLSLAASTDYPGGERMLDLRREPQQ